MGMHECNFSSIALNIAFERTALHAIKTGHSEEVNIIDDFVEYATITGAWVLEFLEEC